MVDSENQYIEIAVGHPRNRGTIIRKSELQNYMTNGQPLFRSYYSYDNEVVEHFKSRKTIKNFAGKYYLDRIIFDIDKGTNSDKLTLQKVITFIDGLKVIHSVPKDWIQIWFSGRGYHIVIPDIFGFEPSSTLPQIVKINLETNFPEADNIYDGARLIRVGFTVNEKTDGYYKTPITYKELTTLSTEEIKELSKTIRGDYIFNKIDSDTTLLPIIKSKEIKRVSKEQTEFDPTGVITCVQNMWKEGDVPGNRHKKLLRMASHYFRNGIPMDGTNSMLTSWADSLDSSEVKRIVKDVWNKGYRYGCFDSVMDKYCESKCMLYSNKQKNVDGLVPILTAQQMEQNYIHRLRNNVKNKGFNLADIYNLSGADYWILPGDMVIIEGDTGLGKTSFVQNWVVGTEYLKVLWLTLENTVDLMYRRFLQIAMGKTKEEVDNHYLNNDNTWSDVLSHINCMSIPPTIKSIEQQVAQLSPQILVVDTIDCIRVSKYVHDGMFKIDSIIEGLRNIATQKDIIVIGVSHISKADSRMGALDVHSGKGSSSIAQKADKVISIEGKRNAINRTIISQKNRDDSRFRISCDFDFSTFRFKQVELPFTVFPSDNR